MKWFDVTALQERKKSSRECFDSDYNTKFNFIATPQSIVETIAIVFLKSNSHTLPKMRANLKMEMKRDFFFIHFHAQQNFVYQNRNITIYLPLKMACCYFSQCFWMTKATTIFHKKTEIELYECIFFWEMQYCSPYFIYNKYN